MSRSRNQQRPVSSGDEDAGREGGAALLTEWQMYDEKRNTGYDDDDDEEPPNIVLHYDRLYDILADTPVGLLSSLTTDVVGKHLKDNLGRDDQISRNGGKNKKKNKKTKKKKKKRQDNNNLPFPLGPAPLVRRTNPQTKQRELVYCHGSTKELCFETQLPSSSSSNKDDDNNKKKKNSARRNKSWKHVRDQAHAEIVLRLCPALFLSLYQHITQQQEECRYCKSVSSSGDFTSTRSCCEKEKCTCSLHSPCLVLDPSACSKGSDILIGMDDDNDNGECCGDSANSMIYYGRVRLCSMRLLSGLVHSYRQGRYQHLTLEQLLCWDGAWLHCPTPNCLRHVTFESLATTLSRKDCRGFILQQRVFGCGPDGTNHEGDTDGDPDDDDDDDDDDDSSWMILRQDCPHEPPCLRITAASHQEEAIGGRSTTSTDDDTKTDSYDLNTTMSLGSFSLIAYGKLTNSHQGMVDNTQGSTDLDRAGSLCGDDSSSLELCQQWMDNHSKEKKQKSISSKTRRGGSRRGRSTLSLEPHHHPHDYYNFEGDHNNSNNQLQKLLQQQCRSTRRSFLPDMDDASQVFPPMRSNNTQIGGSNRCYSSSDKSAATMSTCVSGRSCPKVFAENHRAYYQHSSKQRGIRGGKFWLTQFVSGNVAAPKPLKICTPPNQGVLAPPSSPSSSSNSNKAGVGAPAGVLTLTLVAAMANVQEHQEQEQLHQFGVSGTKTAFKSIQVPNLAVPDMEFAMNFGQNYE